MITDTTYQEHDVFEALKGKVVVTEAGTYQHYNAGGQLHRLGGPALIMSDGTQMWFRNGFAHCIDGPAVICANGNVIWYLSGNRLTQQEFNSCIKSGEYNEP